MSVSPDYSQFVDLSLYDKDAADIYEAAITTLQSRMPDWEPTSTNVEVMLLEALALEVSETVFSLNRLPETMIRVLLSLYGVEIDSGERPTVDLEFTAFDSAGYTIPAGTEVSIQTSTGDFVSFFTDEAATIVEDTTTVVVGATSDQFTNIANGLPVGTTASLLDSLEGVESVQTDTVVSGGALPESIESWTIRGAQRLRRLVDTLVIPIHFTQAALEDPNVFRANTVDNFDPTADPSGDPGDHPGNVTVVVYGDGGPLTSGQKMDLPESLEQRANANLIIHVVDPTIVTVDVEVEIVVKPTFTEATVIQAVEARLAEYLSPTSWPWSGTVRRNELISVIDQVSGVDYVSDLVEPAADVVVGADTALAADGTITVTAV